MRMKFSIFLVVVSLILVCSTIRAAAQDADCTPNTIFKDPISQRICTCFKDGVKRCPNDDKNPNMMDFFDDSDNGCYWSANGNYICG